MPTENRVPVGRIEALWRYPVKSMLGETVPAAEVDERGVAGDRAFAVVDQETGVVATAKNPRRWRTLLQARAEAIAGGAVLVHLPDGRSVPSTDAAMDEALSAFLGRPVTLASKAEPGGQLERATPEEVLERGVDAEVGVTPVEFAAAAPPGTFFDFTPLQMVTTASLRRVGELHPAGRVEAVRYRPNVIIDTGGELSGFVENDWVDQFVHLGPEVVVKVLVPSPRCAVPTLAHGNLPPDPDALRVPLRHNHVEVPIEGFGAAPCVGVHVAVVRPGRVAVGDEVALGVTSERRVRPGPN